MPINPFIDLFGTGAARGAGGLGAAGGAGVGAAAGGAAGLAGIPWTILVPALLSIFGGLFEKEEDPLSDALDLQQQMRTLNINPPYQSPYLPQLNEAAFKAVMAQLGRTANFGWPEGQGIDLSFIQDILGSAPSGTGGTRRRLPVGDTTRLPV